VTAYSQPARIFVVTSARPLSRREDGVGVVTQSRAKDQKAVAARTSRESRLPF
jgi:hypothetical protein